MIRSLALLCFLAVAVPTLALAGTAVTLRSQPVSHGDSVTLGDVFDGVQGAATVAVIGHAAQPGLDTVLDAEAVQQAARRLGYDWANETGYHRIIVNALAGEAASSSGARPVRAKAAAPRRGRAAQALTYARNIMAGEMVSADDLVWSSDAVAPADGVSDPDAAIGKAARHALRAGAPAAVHDLVWPKVIKRDDVISVVFEDEGISLTLQAKAMADASVGDTLDVTNPQSKKVIEATCTGPGQAVVGPRAEAIRAASYHPGGQGRLLTASLH